MRFHFIVFIIFGCIIQSCHGSRVRLDMLSPEMDHSVIENEYFLWITRILDVIITLIVLIQIIIHIIKTSCNINDKKTKKHLNNASSILNKWSLLLTIQTWIYFVISFIFIVLMTLNIWSLFDDINICTIMGYIMVIIFHLNKGLYYCLLITRLQVAFGLSIYKYSIYVIYLGIIIVLIYTIAMIFGSYFAIYGVLLSNPVMWCHIHIHDSKTVRIGILTWIIVDLLLSFILMVLFVKPLSQLLNDVKSASNKKQIKFKDLMIKSVILTIISSIFTILAFMVYLLTHLTILIEINIPIQILCFSLTQKVYKNTYFKLCGFCHKMLTRTYNSRGLTGHLKPSLAMTNTDTNTNTNSGQSSTMFHATPALDMNQDEIIEININKDVKIPDSLELVNNS